MARAANTESTRSPRETGLSAVVPAGANVVFIDGECIVCNRMVSFILAHDPRGLFHFAHLQGTLAKEVLGRYGRNAGDVDSIYVLVDAGAPGEELVWNGRAARAIWPRLFWWGAVLNWIPLPILDFGYQAFAKRRYRLFGKYDACRVPSPNERARFLDPGDGPRDEPRDSLHEGARLGAPSSP